MYRPWALIAAVPALARSPTAVSTFPTSYGMSGRGRLFCG